MLKRFEQVNGKGKYREFMEKLRSITDVKVYNDNLRKKLDQLTQKDSFENYLQKFMSLVQQLDNIDGPELLYRFESGLKTDAKNQLSLIKVNNFDEAAQIVTRFKANRRNNREESTTNKLNYTKSHFPKANRKWTTNEREKTVINKYIRRDNTNHGFRPKNKFKERRLSKEEQRRSKP